MKTPLVDWKHQAQGPFAVERFVVGDFEIVHHQGLAQALKTFWADIGQPASRSVVDAQGKLLIWQQTGAEVGFAATEEISNWCIQFLPPDVVEAIGWLFHFFKHANGQEG